MLSTAENSEGGREKEFGRLKKIEWKGVRGVVA